MPAARRTGTIARALRRAGAIVTALTALVCTLTVQTSEAAVAHVRCVEHGELTHVRAIAQQSSAGGPSRIAAPIRAGGIDHEHCPMPAASHCAQLAAAPPAIAAVAVVAVVRSLAPPEYLAPAPLRYAPKTSPPV